LNSLCHYYFNFNLFYRLAIRILATRIPHLADALEAFSARSEAEVLSKATLLEQVGWKDYLDGMSK
jgi:hypothetical protein